MIIGNAQTINKARQAGPDAKWNHVNFDAIEALPEEYEAVITEVRYDPKNLKSSFSDVGGGSYMPKPELMYEIAEACGIAGGERSINEPLIEEVDWSRISASVNAKPEMVRMTVGRTVKKFSEVMQEDGTLRRSSVCTSSYNAYERCCELWSKEESYTEGYTKAGQYPNKYQTRYQRRAHFDGELKFAGAKAETKAHLKTIRELAGLMTGYKAEDLQSGVLVFAKIRRSSAILKMESAARLSAISRGESSQALLFEPPAPTARIEAPVDLNRYREEPTHEDDYFDTIEPEMVPAQNPTLSTKDKVINTLSKYIERGLLSEKMFNEAKRIIDWLGKITTAPEESKNWPDVLKSFMLIDESVISEGRIPHGLG